MSPSRAFVGWTENFSLSLLNIKKGTNIKPLWPGFHDVLSRSFRGVFMASVLPSSANSEGSSAPEGCTLVLTTWLKPLMLLMSSRHARTWAWDLLLQSLQLDKCLLEQQNTKKLKGTKNKHMHACLGLIMDNMIQKDQKPHCYFRMRCTHHQRGGLPPAQPMKRPPPSRPSFRERAGEAVTCSCSFLLQQGPQ